MVESCLEIFGRVRFVSVRGKSKKITDEISSDLSRTFCSRFGGRLGRDSEKIDGWLDELSRNIGDLKIVNTHGSNLFYEDLEKTNLDSNQFSIPLNENCTISVSLDQSIATHTGSLLLNNLILISEIITISNIIRRLCSHTFNII